jgi:hypothetical protein
MLTPGQARFFSAVGLALALMVVAVLAVTFEETRSAAAAHVVDCPTTAPAAATVP